MRPEFALPLDAMGLLLISSPTGYTLASFFIARLIKKFWHRPLLVFSGWASAAAYLSYPLAPAWGRDRGHRRAFRLWHGRDGCGLNTYLAAGYSESEMQWLHAFFGIGATLSPIIMTASLARFVSWRPGYWVVGALMLAIGAAFWAARAAWKAPRRAQIVAAEATDTGPGMMEYQTSVWASLLQPQAWVGIALFLLYTGAELTLGNWTYTLFTEGRGISPEIAGIWAGGFWATFTIGRVIGALYAHRLRLDTLLIGAMSLSLAGGILFWWNPFPLAGVLGVFVVGFAMAPVFPGLISSTSRRVGRVHAANTIGIQISAAGVGGALLPGVGGPVGPAGIPGGHPGDVGGFRLLGMLTLYVLSTRFKTAVHPIPQRSPMNSKKQIGHVGSRGTRGRRARGGALGQDEPRGKDRAAQSGGRGDLCPRPQG
jgi:fucose permease